MYKVLIVNMYIPEGIPKQKLTIFGLTESI